jgi:acyl carrier protein
MIKKLGNIFEEVLHVKATSVNEGLSIDMVKNWDSLNHLKLVMAIEKEFNVQFDTMLITELTSAKKIDDALKNLGIKE